MFQGFSPETIDFLWGIRMNNNRDWFMPNKKMYTQFLYEPMKALGADLFQSFLDKPGNLLKVSRIYRDARLHHPDPNQESLWICIRRDVEWWAENPCLYFEINPEGVHYGCFFWHPRPQKMEEFLALMDSGQAATGTPVTADLYKRPKEAADQRLAPYFAWKGNIACVRDEPVSEDIFGPALGQRAKEFQAHLIPLYDYLNRFAV